MKHQPVIESVSVELDGRVFDGTYSVQSKVITVDSDYGSASTQLGGTLAPVLARMLLREIVAGAQDRGEL